jgi:hypothetical protein
MQLHSLRHLLFSLLHSQLFLSALNSMCDFSSLKSVLLWDVTLLGPCDLDIWFLLWPSAVCLTQFHRGYCFVFPPVLTALWTYILQNFFSFALSSMLFLFKYCNIELLLKFNILFHIEPLLTYGCCIQFEAYELNYYFSWVTVILQYIIIIVILLLLLIIITVIVVVIVESAAAATLNDYFLPGTHLWGNSVHFLIWSHHPLPFSILLLKWGQKIWRVHHIKSGGCDHFSEVTVNCQHFFKRKCCDAYIIPHTYCWISVRTLQHSK